MRRLVLLAMATLLAAAGCGKPPVTIICPWAAGGGTDRVSRFWAEALQQRLDRPVVVVNRTGGSGAVGHTAGAQARPDGSTITMITFELCTMHRMGISKLTYQDFRCLVQVNADAAAIIVRQDAPWSSLRELLDDVQKRPGKVRMSGTDSGGAWDLARAGLLRADGQSPQAIVWIPTDGAAPSLKELIGGHLEAVCCSVPEAAQSMDSGELRVLAVLSEERLEEFPDVPTAREQGVDWVALGWRGLALPKDTPPQEAAELERICLEIARSPEYAEFMKKNGFGIAIRGSDEFTKFLEQQDAQWNAVVEAAGYSQ